MVGICGSIFRCLGKYGRYIHMTDESDKRLLRLLQQNARLSNAELAEQAALSPSSCWRRVRALEEDGTITRYTALVDPRRVGLAFEAIVHVQLDRHDSAGVQAFMTMVRDHDEVVECSATTGTADYHMRVICRDIDAYNQFLERALFRLPCVRSAQTNMVLKKIKSNAPIAG